MKDTQIETSNKQIAALTERVGESNKLFLGFQQLLGLRSTPKDEKGPRPAADDEVQTCSRLSLGVAASLS